MEQSILKIKCPCCGAVLAVRNKASIENLSITCPNCKTKSPFTVYKAYNSRPVEEDATVVGPSLPEQREEVETVTGRLVLMPTGEIMNLKLGKNVVGRYSSKSLADVKIPTDSREVSRNHSLIEVKQVTGKGMVYYISNYENKNETVVGDQVLEDGDCVILKNGDLIRMANVTLRFEVCNGNKD